MWTPLLLPLLVALQLLTASSPAVASSHISVVISQSGLDFAKDLLVSRAVATLTPLSVPDIERTMSIPLVGTVRMAASGIVLNGLDVTNSTVAVGDTGVVVAASLASANLTMEWSYSYSEWIVTISDSGNASIQVEGMEVGVSMVMKNQKGSIKLSVTECSCYMEDLDITLNGGASWFYQVFIDGFSNHIRSSVENAIKNKVMEGALKLDSFLGNLPKKIDLDSVAAMNVTFVNDPLFKSSSVEFDIDGLFIPSDETAPRDMFLGDTQFALPLGGSSRMLWISLDEDVFNSVSALYFKAGLLQRMVDKIPDQFLLNTASWRFLVPRLYREYPDDDMLLNISAVSPPVVRINVGRIDATVDLDVTVNVLDFGEIVPVACLSVSVDVSGAAAVSENNLVGRVELDYFSFTLKWSKVGKLHTILVQTVLRILLKILFVPYVNSYLKQGFQLPIIKGFSIIDAYILTSYSRIIVSCDVSFIEPEVLSPVQESKTNEDLSHEVSLLVGSAKTWQLPITSENSSTLADIATIQGLRCEYISLSSSRALVIVQGGLPMYIATRGLYNLKPPTVFVPPCIRDDVEDLLQIHRRMSQIELKVELVALDLGETYEIRNDLVSRPFQTYHAIPSQGYVIYSIRRKLKKQYAHLKGSQIMKLKQSGTEITDTILYPEVAFTGDTKSDFILDPRNADALRAKVLITEATFLDDHVDVEHAREHGHMHLSEIMEHSQWFRNETIVLTHFSNRYSLEDIRQAVSRLQPKLSSKVVALTEGFKSEYK